ncbi:hypothetical protein J2129_000561 [Methanofollis sp. W23]|uniref:hypothetical protein n=1 Tax=Methanofollis sp. W23 TaxID=2817849 RepID=UPI001AE6541F|nr:hypothetical protein [Methanofollis sp. W23]MBP2145107.1 hypothetical protein [Methanofollis sp. W23]
MKIRRRTRIWMPVLAGVVIAFVFCGYLSANPCDEVSSEEEMIMDVLPDIRADDLEWLLGRHVYRTYGQVTPLNDTETEGKWFHDLSFVLNKSKPGLASFFPEGPVCGYGINYLGAIEVYLNENEDYDETTTDAIYAIIDGCGKAEGVNATPVIFIHASPMKLD